VNLQLCCPLQFARFTINVAQYLYCVCLVCVSWTPGLKVLPEGDELFDEAKLETSGNNALLSFNYINEI
jgi:hypothetical protein